MYFLTGRQWVYQTCAEFGFYQSTDSPNQPFAGFPLVWVHQTWPVKLTHLIAYSVVILIGVFFFFFPSRYFLKQCTNFYNISAEQVAEAVTQTNEYYGAYDIRSSRIVFPNGSIDPWHALGVTQDISADLPAIFIKGEQKWCIMNFYVKFVLHSGYTFVGRMSVSNHEISICPNNPC